ncbi:nuclear transport factor 2 family protein [Kribbella sp. NPDC050470]|uniref:nuclear transport factor 2 family protein n=1 Tax=unclassified Kribbella TaxID=2644121 RepID=UPI0037A57BDA
MIRPERELAAINLAIGDAEASADRAFFERLLAPTFSMGRPDGVRFDDRATFLDSLTVSSPRQTRIESTTMFDNRAVVVCAVSKATPAGAQHFRNIRVFTRQADGAGWQLVSWVNEPLAPLGIAGDAGVPEDATPVGGA